LVFICEFDKTGECSQNSRHIIEGQKFSSYLVEE